MIEIYKAPEGDTQINVTFEKDTVWLNQEQLSLLFDRDRTTITKHIRNIFKEKELIEDVVCAKIAHTTKHGALNKRTQLSVTTYYNLDVIISVGYRVKSLQGTLFRQWATQRLKDYLIQGYAINEKRLAEREQRIEYLKTGIRILSRAIETQAERAEDDSLLLFSKGLDLLDDYDHEQLDAKGITVTTAILPEREEYLDVVKSMQSEFQSDVFAKPKDQSFESSIAQIGQSFAGSELYPSIEEKAATLLYLIVKNHSFVDGNKRIGAACFLYFLNRNGLLMKDEETPIISSEALAALTLFVASSKTEEMATVKKLIISILNRK